MLRVRRPSLPSHEYHLVWLPPAPLAPPRLTLCSSNGTFGKVRSRSLSRVGGGWGSGAAAADSSTLCLSSLPRSWHMSLSTVTPRASIMRQTAVSSDRSETRTARTPPAGCRSRASSSQTDSCRGSPGVLAT